MKYNDIKYTILTLLIAFGALTSCIDDDFVTCEDDDAIPEGFTDGYAINLAVTLDNMGGTRATTVPELEEMENYIDPQKFRVLFFDSKDEFLFESKSRWIKQLTPTGSANSQWLVSVPIYTYGNDEEYNWDWEEIRKALTEEDHFKIAILANRPGEEWCPKFDDTKIVAAWFDNSGPHWKAKHTSWYVRKYGGTAKTVFDLHHSQYDPIYTGKSWPDNKTYSPSEEGFYEFVMGSEDGRLTMSSTSSWVDWGENDENNKDPYGYSARYFVRPSMSHPIPMYGIQKFDPIKNWIKGTPFHLSQLTQGQLDDNNHYNFNSISLLRSVVRLDLVIPQSADYKVKYVFIGYPNIYARCEPMDVWTPTDELWAKEHDDNCEWYAIKDYGPISRTYDVKTNSSLLDYQKRLCWFYGSWLNRPNSDEPWWKFGSLGTKIVKEAVELNGPSPHLFNPCIQRNNVGYCGDEVNMTDQYNDNNYHYVVYLGERNVNDPTKLNNLGNNGSGDATIIYWEVCIETNGVYKYYRVPLTDFADVENIDQIIQSGFVEFKTDGKFETKPNTGMQYYENLVQDPDDTTPKPWPLMRNHIYRTTISPAISYVWDFKVKSADNLNADSKWSNPWGIETKILSNNDGLLTNNANGYADVNWEWSGKTTLERESGNSFNQDKNNKIEVNGASYIPIKTGKGENGANDRQTKLTVPDTKVINKFTLYSFISKPATIVTTTTTPINYPSSQGGISLVKEGTAKFSSVNIHQNKDNVEGIKISDSTPKNGVALDVLAGFRDGDKIEFTGTFNDDDNSKQSAFAIYASNAENATPIKIFDKNTVNGKTSVADPATVSYTLDNAYSSLYIGCVGAGGIASGETKEWKDPSKDLDKETAIMTNDMVTITTAHATTRGTRSNVTIDGHKFSSFITLRTNAEASSDNLTGGQHFDKNTYGTSLIVSANKNVEITLYFRRQKGSSGYNLNDNKDMLCYDQNANSKYNEAVEDTWDIDGSYAYAKKTYKFTAGSTYTLYRNGSTIELYGFTVKESSGAEKLATDMYITNIKVTRTSKYKEPMPEAFWAEVAGESYGQYQTGLNAFAGERVDNKQRYDKHEFKTTGNPNSITFTSSDCGEQFCYVAAVEVKDKNSTINYWGHSISTNGDGGGKELQVTINNKDATLGELAGLTFYKDGSIKIYDEEEGKISLNGTTFDFPTLKKGYTITIVGQSPSSTSPGSISTSTTGLTGSNNYTFGADQQYTVSWTVTNDKVTPKFKVTGEVDFYEFRIDASTTRSVGSAGSGFSIKSENLYSKSLKVE